MHSFSATTLTTSSTGDHDPRGISPVVGDIGIPMDEWSLPPAEIEVFQSFQGGSVAVRIDAVTQLHDGLVRFIEFALHRGIGFSLEIPPCSCHIADHQIKALVGSAPELKIGQHGLAADTSVHDPPQVFSASEAGVRSQIASLERGKLYIEQHFGPLFSGGYSAPDDRVPAWIAQAWHELGGRFISFVTNRPKGARLRTVKLSTRFWDPERNCPRGQQTILGDLRKALAQLGYAGLVLHEEQLRSLETVKMIQVFFQSLQTAGLRLVHPDAQARFQAETLASSPYRDYRRGIIPNA